MVEVKVTGGTIPEGEKAAYVSYIQQKHKDAVLSSVDILVDGDYVELRYVLAPKPFNRIRRITGYLVGDVSRWNDAKRKELAQRTMSASADPSKKVPGRRMSDRQLRELSEYARSLI